MLFDQLTSGKSFRWDEPGHITRVISNRIGYRRVKGNLKVLNEQQSGKENLASRVARSA